MDHPEHLSYAAATTVAILSKDQFDGAEMWEAEVSSYLKINLRNSLVCISHHSFRFEEIKLSHILHCLVLDENTLYLFILRGKHFLNLFYTD